MPNAAYVSSTKARATSSVTLVIPHVSSGGNLLTLGAIFPNTAGLGISTVTDDGGNSWLFIQDFAEAPSVENPTPAGSYHFELYETSTGNPTTTITVTMSGSSAYIDGIVGEYSDMIASFQQDANDSHAAKLTEWSQTRSNKSLVTYFVEYNSGFPFTGPDIGGTVRQTYGPESDGSSLSLVDNMTGAGVTSQTTSDPAVAFSAFGFSRAFTPPPAPGNIVIEKATNPSGSSQSFNFSLYAPGEWQFVDFPSYNGPLTTTPTDIGLNETGLSPFQWISILQGTFFGGIGAPGYPPSVNAQFSSTVGVLTPIPGSPVFQLVPAAGTYGTPPGGTQYTDLSGNTTNTPIAGNLPTSPVTGAVTVFMWIDAGSFSFSAWGLNTSVWKWVSGSLITTFSLMDGQTFDSGPLAAGTYSVVEDPVAGWITTTSQDPNAIVVGSTGTTTVTFTNTLPSVPCVPVGGNGVLVTDLSLYIGPSTALYTSPVPSGQIADFETTNEGRHAIVLDFNQGGGLYARDLGTIFSWPLASQTVLYVWQPSIIPMPEGTYGRATDWIDGGSGGAKFIQGVMVEADSFNNPKTFFLQDSDTLAMHPLNECPATFNQQSEIAFSCAPFVAHSARLISTDGVEWRVWNTKLVFQPWPELCFNWQTELTSLGMIGWGHVREMNLAYVSYGAPVTLVLTFDSWPTITLVLPDTAASQAKTKVTLPPNKFKLVGLQTFSTGAAHRIFADDLQLKIGQWGRTESYQILRPFGGPSRTGAVV